MESLRPFALVLLFVLPVTIRGWGVDGHFATCKIAQGRLSQAAADAVSQLLPQYAKGDLASLCSWADHVKFRYHWSSPLHYIDTPDNLCTYQSTRDCKDADSVMGRCVAGAVRNYTSQLLEYSNQTSQYNLTESLLFLSHFMGDIHQPLHVGFTSDRGGNTIDVHWFTRKAVLHHVWDDSIIESAEDRFYGSNVENYIDAIQRNITHHLWKSTFEDLLVIKWPKQDIKQYFGDIDNEWADQVEKWENCSGNQTTCPNIYASEGIKAACDWAYKGVANDSVLRDEYFLSRLPIVNMRLAQGGVRLAATLNRIFE